jgi:hypothetical protein
MERGVPMPQISLYIDEATLKKVEDAAARQHSSISKWVAEQIRARIEPRYPMNFESLFGSIADTTFHEPPELSFDSDAKREKLS